jgi:hypothetical protein|tara:strand:- start:241 stop:819 length:579 start_codon:yes stop_codon:yes gene_type:complete
MALINFAYNKIASPNQFSDDGDWDEDEWLELASRPRFWPGFIDGFLQNPDVRKDMIDYFGDLEGIPRDKMVEILSEPIKYKDRLVTMIQDFKFDYEFWEGSEDPWHLILTMTPGYFEYTARVVGDRIQYSIYEIVTDLTPAMEQPDSRASQEVIAANEQRKDDNIRRNQATIKELAEALGISLSIVMNRREV